MPIKKEEFESGRSWDTLEGQILSYLRANRSSAFTLSDILNALGHTPQIKDFGGLIGFVTGSWMFQNALDSLMKEGSVRAKRVKTLSGEQIYYMAK
jgi:hypothetical protein